MEWRFKDNSKLINGHQNGWVYLRVLGIFNGKCLGTLKVMDPLVNSTMLPSLNAVSLVDGIISQFVNTFSWSL